MPPTTGRAAAVVSIHDVSPRTRTACERILAEIAALGIGATSLLVIPDHHHRGHFLEDPAFCRWLGELTRDGHEAVMHGYFHQRARRERETVVAKMTTRFYTADEGEFYDIDRETARVLVSRAREEFHGIGLDPRGFIAPAWLLGTEAEAALRELEIEYTTRLGSVLVLHSGIAHRSQSLVWSVRSGWRRAMSLVWNASLFKRLAANPLMRISIHPVDIEHPVVWQQIRTLIARVLADRKALTYQAWLKSLES